MILLLSVMRSIEESGRLVKAVMRLRKNLSVSSKAARYLKSGPASAAGSLRLQWAVMGCRGQIGQAAPAALSQTVKDKIYLGHIGCGKFFLGLQAQTLNRYACCHKDF